MRTQISSKIAALGLALLMNSMIIGGVSQLFSSHFVQRGTALAAVHVPSHLAGRGAKGMSPAAGGTCLLL